MHRRTLLVAPVVGQRPQTRKCVGEPARGRAVAERDRARAGTREISDEERKLASAEYRKELVEALLVGIKRYFAKNPPLARNRQL